MIDRIEVEETVRRKTSKSERVKKDTATPNAASGDYGKQMWQAFLAIRQLYADCARLLQDCDGSIGKGRECLFKNEVTRDLSKLIGWPDSWMASALFRFYDASDESPGLVEGVTICFYDEAEPFRHKEPLLIAGRIQYAAPTKRGVLNPLSSICNPWDLWNAYFHGIVPPRLYEPISLNETYEEGVTAIKLIAIPLYSIKAINDVTQLMEKVRQLPEAPVT